jgi:hypothetical protein
MLRTFGYVTGISAVITGLWVFIAVSQANAPRLGERASIDVPFYLFVVSVLGWGVYAVASTSKQTGWRLPVAIVALLLIAALLRFALAH